MCSSEMKEKKATWPGVIIVSKLGRRGVGGREREIGVGEVRGGCTGICKDDVGDGSEARVEVRLNRHVHLPTARVFHANADHGDHHGGQDGDETRNGHVADLLQRPRQRQDETHNRARNAKGDRTASVRGDGVHHDGEGEDVAAHDED